MYGNELDLSSPGDKHLLNQGWRSLKYYFNEVDATDKQKCILQVGSAADPGSAVSAESENDAEIVTDLVRMMILKSSAERAKSTLLSLAKPFTHYQTP